MLFVIEGRLNKDSKEVIFSAYWSSIRFNWQTMQMSAVVELVFAISKSPEMSWRECKIEWKLFLCRIYLWRMHFLFSTCAVYICAQGIQWVYQRLVCSETAVWPSCKTDRKDFQTHTKGSVEVKPKPKSSISSSRRNNLLRNGKLEINIKYMYIYIYSERENGWYRLTSRLFFIPFKESHVIFIAAELSTIIWGISDEEDSSAHRWHSETETAARTWSVVRRRVFPFG